MKYKYRFTIFTATYNRGNLLPMLYDCIIKQDFKGSFEWIIVSDGSTDNTSEVVNGFILEGKIPIKFVDKPNGGKHTAWRAATPLFEGQYVLTADDDDPILPNALSTFDNAWKDLEKSSCYDQFWEVRTRSMYEDGKLFGSPLPSPYLDSDYITIQYIQKKRAEMHGCRKVEVLQNEAAVPAVFPFEAQASNFPEGIRWANAARKYKTRFLPNITRIFTVGHESLTNKKNKGKLPQRRLYNSLVGALCNLEYLRDILLKYDKRKYLRDIYVILMASIKLHVFCQSFNHITHYLDKVVIILFYPFILFKLIMESIINTYK